MPLGRLYTAAFAVLCVVPCASEAPDARHAALKSRLSDLGYGKPWGKTVKCLLLEADSLSDFKFMTEAQFTRCTQSPPKLAKLRELRESLRDDVHGRRRDSLLVTAMASCEVFIRGFMFGSGFSFLYETLRFDETFYAATTDLPERVQRASYRALFIGLATGVFANGAAMAVPRFMRGAFVSVRG